ncbi:hypothetical protein K4A83_10440 [Spirulina subsalsa FACHB-351]|uniref:Uncharacterized protein n=1 Tax=Spirulina subsalsa FACHB-351 TaxID=234711 RepID=A0ABT3L5E3_9CYAN|nr:hypothetical protein [Spirulina subsalsa]MCW6036677.1 hypothetical protein [Spirulina subsalsa FACHB-351]
MQIIGIILLVAYGVGVWKFWQGYKRTNFQPGLVNRLGLSLLWPVLLPVNRSYRQNFQKALKGR